MPESRAVVPPGGLPHTAGREAAEGSSSRRPRGGWTEGFSPPLFGSEAAPLRGSPGLSVGQRPRRLAEPSDPDLSTGLPALLPGFLEASYQVQRPLVGVGLTRA